MNPHKEERQSLDTTEFLPYGGHRTNALPDAPAVSGPLFRIENLSLSYGNKPTLENVSMDIQRGLITALIGPSGVGKSTFLSTLNRLTDLIPGCHVTGTIRMGNRDILAPDVDVQALRRQVGMIFQKPVPFPFSIRRNIELPLREHGIRQRDKLEEILERALRDVGLWSEVKDRLDVSALALSGGQQQRLCIARALALEPEAILMDEPCSALDPISSGVVEDLILRLRESYTVVIVTHNLAQASRIADYAGLFWLRDVSGQIVEFGPCQQVFENPQHELTAAYISGSRG